MTLVLLMTAASGAWATSDISRALLSVPNSWGKDQEVYLTAEELPGFKAVTEEEAANWVPTDEDIENGAFLIYGFDAEGNMLSYATLLGAPAIKVDPGKMPHNNMYALTHGSILQVRFYYTSDVTLVGDKTEATFAMPAADATVDYELVRDMSVQMPVTVGDGQDGYRIRLKMEDEAYVLAEMQPEEARALINVHDAIENKNLVFAGDGAVCTVDIYAVDEEDKATGNAIAFADLTPGRYVAIATAADGTAYDGQTAQSNVFELYEGFPVVVPATEEEGGEVDLGTVSFYTEQFNLKLETGSSAKLYTLTAIDGHTVTATEVDVVPAGMPFFVLNETDAEQMVTLLPATAEEVTTTPTPIIEFLGTDVDLTFTQEDMDGAYDYYILHRGIFVWVKDPGTLKAGKCYLRILKGQPTTARQLTIVFDNGETTAIDNGKLTIDNEAGAVYDLSGRRVSKPGKGVFIQNGKKVVK
jgi:hypothetical protein